MDRGGVLEWEDQTRTGAGLWWRPPLIPELGSRQVDLCEFKANLGYRVSSWTGFKATEKPCLEKRKTKKEQTNRTWEGRAG